MSDLLNSLNVPSSEPPKSWAQEVAEAGAAEAPAAAPEPVAPAPAPAPEQETAPEPSQPQETAPHEDDRRVPLKALQEERQKRAEYERKLADYERQMNEMRAWAEQVQQKIAPPEPQAVEPDPETDPIGALKHARDQLKRMQEHTESQRYEAQLNQIAFNAANQFKQQAPDYQDAYRYAINSRAQELMALGTPENAIPQILQREEMSLIDAAVRNNRNPAEAIYTFAKARGYNAAPAPAPVAPAPAPAPVNPALQQAKQAVAASASASGAPAAKGDLSVADISNLKGAAFDAAWNKLFGGNKSSMFRE
jgi:hypothetical protein